MGRGSRSKFKYYMPEIPVEQFEAYGITMPAAGHYAEKYEYVPPTAEDGLLTEAEFEDRFKVDEASKVVKWAQDATAQTDYHFIGVDTTNQAVTITLPNKAGLSSGKILLIKDEGGNAGTNSITVNTSDGSTIDGAPSISLGSDHAAISLYYNGVGWHIY